MIRRPTLLPAGPPDSTAAAATADPVGANAPRSFVLPAAGAGRSVKAGGPGPPRFPRPTGMAPRRPADFPVGVPVYVLATQRAQQHRGPDQSRLLHHGAHQDVPVRPD